MPTHYEILQVHRRAPTSSIKAAYRYMARIHHPDKGGNPEVFKSINEAYTILSNDTTRRAYDFNDLTLCDLFASSDPPLYSSKPVNTIQNLVVSLADICIGANLSVCVSRTVVNERQLRPCETCNGTGVLFLAQQLSGLTPPVHKRCTKCTTGYTPESIATYTINQEVVCRVPKGCPHGMMFYFKGMGNQSVGTDPADLLIKIVYASSEVYRVPWDSLDLIHTLVVTLYESLTGFTRLLHHPDGRTLRICTQKVTSPGLYTVLDHGIDFVSRSRRGHLYIHIQVKYPSRIDVSGKTLSEILSHPATAFNVSRPGDMSLQIDNVQPPTRIDDIVKETNLDAYSRHCKQM